MKRALGRGWVGLVLWVALGACRSLAGAPAAPARLAAATLETPLRLNQPVTLKLQLPPALREALPRAGIDGGRAPRFVLRVDGLVAPPADDVGVQVYIGLAEEPPRLDAAERAGSFAFYPAGERAAPFMLDARAALARLRARALADARWEALAVTLVLVPLRGDVGRASEGVAVRGGRVSLGVE